MEDPNILNIPAYQRKRSIMAKANKKVKYLQPDVPKTPKPKKARTRKKAAHTIQEAITEMNIRPTISSQELFPDPFFDAPKNFKTLREWRACGICEGYFDKIDVAIVKVTSAIRIGDIIIFEKQDGLFEKEVKSMQIDRRDINLATTGSEIGMKVDIKPIIGSTVYKLVD